MDNLRIKNIKELKTLAERDCGLDCYIALNYGARSSKHITYDPDTKLFSILNEIDDTTQKISEDQFFNTSITNIGTALRLGGLFAYPSQV